MTLAAPAAEAAATIDPTALALLSIFGGAALAALAGLFGAWLQGRREHQKWVREKRYEAFLAVETEINRRQVMDIARRAAEDTGHPELWEHANKLRRDAVEAFPAAIAPLALLGPDEVSRAAQRVKAAIAGNDDDATQKVAFDAFTAAVRKALKVKG